MAALYLLPDETQYRKLFSASAVRPVVVGSLSESTIRSESIVKSAHTAKLLDSKGVTLSFSCKQNLAGFFQ